MAWTNTARPTASYTGTERPILEKAFLLNEDGTYILNEDTSFILLEESNEWTETERTSGNWTKTARP
jgi:hypothetical protein